MPRLVRVTRESLEIARRRIGRGFAYFDADGRRVSDPQVRDRIAVLAIPPAWQDVRIAAHPRAHLQCCGTDEAGRIQYVYHPDWEARRAAHKQKRLRNLVAALPVIRRRVSIDLQAPAGSRELALALAVALIDRTAMRVGRERYLAEHGTRGAGTLYARDVKVDTDTVHIAFPAKSGKFARYSVRDPQLAEAIARIRTLPGKRLLVHCDAQGAPRPLNTAMINSYLRQISGSEVTAKDFRTLHASALAGEKLAALEPAPTDSARRRQIARVVREVADVLQNTPAVCRKSYIAACLLNLFERRRLATLWFSDGTGNSPRARERRLGALIEAIGQATSATGSAGFAVRR